MFLSDEHKSRDRRDPWGHRKYMDMGMQLSLSLYRPIDADRFLRIFALRRGNGQGSTWVFSSKNVSGGCQKSDCSTLHSHCTVTGQPLEAWLHPSVQPLSLRFDTRNTPKGGFPSLVCHNRGLPVAESRSYCNGLKRSVLRVTERD